MKDRIIRIMHREHGTFRFMTFPSIFGSKGLLSAHLVRVFTFMEGSPSKDKSPSSAKPLMLEVEKVEDDITEYAKGSDYMGTGKNQHFIVQDYLMKNDPHMMAAEVPVWNEDMSGFIDIIRVFGDGIRVYDFKPNAHKEDIRKVATQLWYDKKMLCERTGIEEKVVTCYYFDHINCYKLL